MCLKAFQSRGTCSRALDYYVDVAIALYYEVFNKENVDIVDLKETPMVGSCLTKNSEPIRQLPILIGERGMVFINLFVFDSGEAEHSPCLPPAQFEDASDSSVGRPRCVGISMSVIVMGLAQGDFRDSAEEMRRLSFSMPGACIDEIERFLRCASRLQTRPSAYE